MFYLTTHSSHFIYGYMASDIWLRTILIVRKETRCRHIGYSYRLTARVLLYAPSHIQDNTYHGLCYTSRGALARTRNSTMGITMVSVLNVMIKKPAENSTIYKMKLYSSQRYEEFNDILDALQYKQKNKRLSKLNIRHGWSLRLLEALRT